MIKLSKIVRVLDFDGSVTEQVNLGIALGDRVEIVDLQAIGPSLRYLCGRGAVRRFERSVLSPATRDRLTFLGSGDFHHVTASLLRQFDEPLTVIVFDRHSDWDRRPPWPCCGSWLAEAVALPHVLRIISVGLGKEDIGGWRIMLGRVSDLLSGKIAFYPYDCQESRYGARTIRWRTLIENPWNAIRDEIIEAIPTKSVYLSIDKDCLDADEAFTNWELGHLRLEQITDFIARLSRRNDIAGADITGEYSPIAMRNPFFRAIALADHPQKPPFEAADKARNEATNLTLISALCPAESAA